MSDLNSIETDRFNDFALLLRIMGDPQAYEAKMKAYEARLTAVAKGEKKLEADRAAFDADVATKTAELEEKRRRAAGIWKVAEEREREAAAFYQFRESLMSLLREVGIRELPTSVPVDGSATMMKANEDFVTVLDQVRRVLGRPSVAEEARGAKVMRDEIRAELVQLVDEPLGGAATGGRLVARPRRPARVSEEV